VSQFDASYELWIDGAPAMRCAYAVPMDEAVKAAQRLADARTADVRLYFGGKSYDLTPSAGRLPAEYDQVNRANAERIGRENAECVFDQSAARLKRDYGTQRACIQAFRQNVRDTMRENGIEAGSAAFKRGLRAYAAQIRILTRRRVAARMEARAAEAHAWNRAAKALAEAVGK